MAKKKGSDALTRELQDNIAKNTVLFGTAQTIKAMRASTLQKVLISSNAPENIRKDLSYYASINNVDLTEISQTNEELGTLCKKPFSVSVVGMLKQ